MTLRIICFFQCFALQYVLFKAKWTMPSADYKRLTSYILILDIEMYKISKVGIDLLVVQPIGEFSCIKLLHSSSWVQQFPYHIEFLIEITKNILLEYYTGLVGGFSDIFIFNSEFFKDSASKLEFEPVSQHVQTHLFRNI